MEMQTEGVIIMRLLKRSVGVLVAALVGVLVAVAFATTVAGGRGPATTSGVAVPAGQSMDLVWISDSMGWGVASFYARHIRGRTSESPSVSATSGKAT